MKFPFSSSSFFHHNSKTTWCMQLLHKPNYCFATGKLLFLAWGSIQPMTGELYIWLENVSKDASHDLLSTSWASVH